MLFLPTEVSLIPREHFLVPKSDSKLLCLQKFNKFDLSSVPPFPFFCYMFCSGVVQIVLYHLVFSTISTTIWLGNVFCMLSLLSVNGSHYPKEKTIPFSFSSSKALYLTLDTNFRLVDY